MTERILMRESTIIRMMEKSEQISRSLVRWGILMVLCIILLVIPDTRNILAIYVAACTLGIGAFIAISLGIVRVRGLQRLIPIEQEPEPPAPDPSDELMFDAAHDGKIGRLENRQGNTIELGEFKLTARQWRALALELRRNTKHGTPLWARERIIHVNGVKYPAYAMPRTEGTHYQAFIGLTAKNDDGQTQFTALTDALVDLNIVHSSKKRLTNYGWEEICRVANLPVL